MKTKQRIFFLFAPSPQAQWSLTRRMTYHSFRAAVLLTVAACMGLALLVLSVGRYGWEVFDSYFSHWKLLALNALPVVCLTALAYGITGRAWLAFALGGFVGMGFSLANYYMLMFRDDPLLMLDLLEIREAANMTTQQNYELTPTKPVLLILGCWLLGIIALAVLCRGVRKNGKVRLIWAAAAVAAMAMLWPVYQDPVLYGSFENFQYLNRWADTQNYLSRGFWYPFLHSARNLVSTPPEGYDPKEVEALLVEYPDADIPEEQKVHIISIMREAYIDFSQFDIPGLDSSGYAPHQALMEESYCGNLLVNIFAGGTVDTERCFLTGNYALREFRGRANSYLWYLREQGYTVEGSHPYQHWFYNRENVNGYLGFERYRFWDGDYETLMAGKLTPGAQMPPDDILFDEVYKDYCANLQTGKPYFSFVLNVESHGPYAEQQLHDGVNYLSGNYSQGCQNALSNYLSTSFRGDEAVCALIEKLRYDPEPVVVLEFSDHLPWMGNGNIYYDELGVDINPVTDQGFRNCYTTHYLIWANEAAKELLGHDMVGTGPTISPNYLMNVLFEQLGWEGPGFMQIMDEMMEVFPVTSVGSRNVVDGALVVQIPQERQALYEKFRRIQYYWSHELLVRTAP